MTNCCIKKKCAGNCEDCNGRRSSCKSCKSKSSSYFCKPKPRKCCSGHKKRKKKCKSRKCESSRCKTSRCESFKCRPSNCGSTKCNPCKCESTRCKLRKCRARKCDQIAVVQIDKSNCCVQSNLESQPFDLGGRRTGRSIYFAKYRSKQLDALEQDCENQKIDFKTRCIDQEVETDDTLCAIPKTIPGANVFLRRGSSRSRYSYKRPQCCNPPKPKKPKAKKNKKCQKKEKCASKKKCDRYLTLSRYYKGQFRPYYDPAPKCETDSGISLKPKCSAFSRALSEPRKIQYNVSETRSQGVHARSLSAPAKSTSPTTNFYNECDENSMSETIDSSEDEECANTGRRRAGSDARKLRRRRCGSQATNSSQACLQSESLDQIRPTGGREYQLCNSCSEMSLNSPQKQCRRSTSRISVTFQNSHERSTRNRYFKMRGSPCDENKNEIVLAVDTGSKITSISTEGANTSTPLVSVKQGSKSRYFKKYCLLTKKIKNVIKKKSKVKSPKCETNCPRKKKIDSTIQAGYKTAEACSSTPHITIRNRNKSREENLHHNRIRCCKSSKRHDRKTILSDTSLNQVPTCGPHAYKDERDVKMHISRGKYRPYRSKVLLESTDQLATNESSGNVCISPNQHRRVTYDPQSLNCESCIINLSNGCRIRAGSSERRSARSNKYNDDEKSKRKCKSKHRRLQRYCPEDDDYSPRFRRMMRYPEPCQIGREPHKKKPRRRIVDECEQPCNSSGSYGRSFRQQVDIDLIDDRHNRKPQMYKCRIVPEIVPTRCRPDSHPHRRIQINDSCSGSSVSITREEDRCMIERNKRICSDREDKRVRINSRYSRDSMQDEDANYSGTRRRCCSERGQQNVRRAGGTCASKDSSDKCLYVSDLPPLRSRKEGCEASNCKKRIRREEGLPVTIIVNPFVKGCKRNTGSIISIGNDNCQTAVLATCSQKKCRSCGKPVVCAGTLSPKINKQRSKSCANKRERMKKAQKGALYSTGSTDIIINRSESSIDIYRIESNDSFQLEKRKCHNRELITDSSDSIGGRNPCCRDRNPCCRDRCAEAQLLGRSRYFSRNRKTHATQVIPTVTDSRTKYAKHKSCTPKKRHDKCSLQCPPRRTRNDCWCDDSNRGMYNQSYHVGFSTCSYNERPSASKCSLLMSCSSLNSLGGISKRQNVNNREDNCKTERCSIINDPKRREKKLRSRYLDRNSRAGAYYKHPVKIKSNISNSNFDTERNDCEIPPQIGYCPERETTPKRSTYRNYWDCKMNDISKCVASVSNTARKVTKWEPEPKLVKYWCECCETFVRPKKKVKRTLFTECVTGVLQCCVPHLKVHVTAYVCPKCQNTLIKFVPENKSAVKGCINNNIN